MLDKRAPLIPGHFCSELVAEVFAGLGIELFADGRQASSVSPNALAKISLLKPLNVIGEPPEGFRDDPELYEGLHAIWAGNTLDRETSGAKLVRGKAFVAFAEQELNKVSAKLDDLIATITQNNAETAAQLKALSDKILSSSPQADNIEDPIAGR
jgi:hypothetical protein